jgi:hypothetical protein
MKVNAVKHEGVGRFTGLSCGNGFKVPSRAKRSEPILTSLYMADDISYVKQNINC